MARTRLIKPGFFRDAKVVSVSPLARLCFIGLWGLADYTGRLKCNPIEIKMDLFPMDDVNVQELLLELHRGGLIDLYRDPEHGEIIHILGFEKHQNPHKNERVAKDGTPCPHLPVRKNGASFASAHEYSDSDPALTLNPLTLTLHSPAEGKVSNTTESTNGTGADLTAREAWG